MVEEVIKGVVSKMIQSDYPHVQLPAVMHAKITKVTISGEWYEYNLKILDKNGVIDARFPEIPNVRSKVQILSGKTAAIGLLYGELNPFIIGEAS